ncbi:hypothetical protein D3C86_1668600 [compost metagenome]
MAQAGVQPVDALLSLSNPRSLTVNGDIVCLAADLAGYGIKLLVHFGNGSVKLISHGIDGIHRDAAIFRIDYKNSIPERVKVTFVLVEFGIKPILHQPDLNARHPQLLLGIIQQILRSFLSLIQPGQLLFDAGDPDLDFIDFRFQERDFHLKL